MNILKKIVLITLVFVGLPMISSAASVSCAPSYSSDYINKTVTWNGEITDDSDLGSIVSYEWTLEEDSSGGAESPFPENVSTTNIYNTAGVKHATFKVIGASSTVQTTCSVLIYDETTLPALGGSCVPTVGSAVVDQSLSWNSTISGGLAPYTVSWGGDASGTGISVTQSYTATGTKTANIVSIASRYPELPVSTSTIVCSPSVRVYPKASPDFFEDNGTTCSVSRTTANTGDSVTWSVDLRTLNGVAPYIISWIGSDGLSGTSTSVSKIYSTAGTKTAKIYSITSSDAQSIVSDIICSNSVAVSVASTGPTGGGGTFGGGSYTPPTTTTTTTTATTTATSTATTTNQLPTEVLGVDEGSELTPTLYNTDKFNIYNPYIFNNDQYFGSKNEDIANLQNRLIKEGFFDSEITGYFGPKTKASLVAYQKANRLTETGILDFETRSMLNGVVEEDVVTSVATSTGEDNLDLTATAYSSKWYSSKWTLILFGLGLITIFSILWKRRMENKNI